MNKLRLVFCILVFTAGANAAQAYNEAIKPEPYMSCQSTDDCVTARGPCGEPHAVNRQYLLEIQAKWDEMATRIDCPEYTASSQTFRPNCSTEKICEMIPAE